MLTSTRGRERICTHRKIGVEIIALKKIKKKDKREKMMERNILQLDYFSRVG